MRKIKRESIYSFISLAFALGGFILGNMIENFPEIIIAIYGVSIVIIISDIIMCSKVWRGN